MKTRGIGSGWSRLLTVVVFLASSAFADGFFYDEVERDGRVYVFASAEARGQFAASGEAGKAITRIGYGPGGETVVFDSEQAIALYNFKHGLPGEPPPPPGEPATKVSWKDGKTTIQLTHARVVLSNRVQFRWTQEQPDDATRLAGTAAAGDSKGSFRIRRAKTKFEGWAFVPELTYTLQLNWADTASSLEDADLTWDASRDGRFRIKVGQFKVPFGRQELTSSGSQQFIDRSAVSNEFAKGRDIGVEVNGQFRSGTLEYHAGVFNGNGRNVRSNDNASYQFDARLIWQPNGDPKLSEGDFESSDRPLWAVAAAYEVNDARVADDASGSRRAVWGFDGVFKYRRFFAMAEVFLRETTPQASERIDSSGYVTQASYRFAPRWEIAGRWGSWDPSDSVANDARTELGGILTYYHAKHALKAQADFRRLRDEAADRTAHELRVQTQIVF